MESYVARQPIFDKDMTLVAYELLYRGDHVIWDENTKSEDVTFNAFHLSLSNHGSIKYFVNFTKNNIMSDLPKVFKSDSLVVEILEDVIPDDAFIKKCNELKSEGYRLALDDFLLDLPTEVLTDLVDIIKVDFLATNHQEREEIIHRYGNKGRILLAEKVETKEEFLEAVECGFDLFQGFFFAKPESLKEEQIPSMKYEYLEILFELMLKEPSIVKIENLIKRNYELTIRLLKIVNSPLFYSNRRVTSIKEAIVLIGLSELRRLVSLLILKNNQRKKSDEIVKYSMFRACFLEKIVKESTLSNYACECFILGLLSCSDVVFNMKLEKVLSFFPVSENVENALLNDSGPLFDLYRFMLSYEKENRDELIEIANRLNIDLDIVSKYYLSELTRIDTLFLRDQC